MERFWMSGRLAENLLEIRNDLSALEEPGFWAVLGTFEGDWTFARFGELSKQDFPESDSKLAIENWKSNFSKSEYCQYVEQIREQIAAGDFYQVNACRILSSEITSGDSLSNLFHQILRENPAPYAAYLNLPGIEIASASPERFLSIAGSRIVTSPIKGTSATEFFPDKDRAENLMIVDLMRNDLSQFCKPGSVKTPRLLDVESHPGLYHLVSDIEGEIAEGYSIGELLSLLMPPGSVSGAPKSSAVKMIKSYEGNRGPYCGVLGWVEDGRAEIAVGIRTFWRTGAEVKFGTGAGITWDSVPEAEWEETELKARKLISLVESSSYEIN
jgi:para-aminobenzoate synthetase component 1